MDGDVGRLAAADRRGMLVEDARGMPVFDFSRPKGAAALSPPDSVSWRVYKNPISLTIGGICAVLMEFAEPGVRAGVWQHSIFKTDPGRRMRRTGMAAMMAVYGPAEEARKLIAGVTRLHAGIEGRTETGASYHALDPALTAWVHATAAYAFLNAYSAYAAPLTANQRDRFYREGAPRARLFRVAEPPLSEAAFDRLLTDMRPGFSASPVIFEFLEIMARKAALPAPLRPIRGMLIRAAVDMLPGDLRALLGLDRGYALRDWERGFLRFAGRRFERLCLWSAPPAQSCLRLGLPAGYLYRSSRPV